MPEKATGQGRPMEERRRALPESNTAEPKRARKIRDGVFGDLLEGGKDDSATGNGSCSFNTVFRPTSGSIVGARPVASGYR